MVPNTSLNLDYEKFYLDNGIKCIVYPRNEIHSVSIRVNVKVGALDEEANTNGLSHFIEHVVHEATEDLPSWEQVEDFKNEYSASTNAYTSLDHTQYYGTFPFQYLDKAVYYFSQIVTKPLFRDADVDKERQIIIDELKSYEDDIDFKILQNIKDNRFTNPKTPYSYDIIGTQKVLKNIKTEDLKNFHKTYYNPENIEIYVLGNFEITELKALLEKGFGHLEKLPNKPERKFKTEFPTYSKFNISAKKKLDLDKYYLTLTFPSFDFKNTSLEDRYKVSFLQAMTASGSYMHSILWKRLRQELGIVYGVYAWNYDMFARDIVGIGTSFDKDHLETVLREYYEGINKVINSEITESVFKSKQKKTVDTQLMQLDKPETAINWIASFEDEIEEHGRGMMISEYLEFVKNLKFEEIIDVAKKIYRWEDVNIGIVSEDDEAEVEKNVTEIWNKIINNQVS